MYEVTMPKLSDSMEEGKIIEWRVAEGDAVSEGDVLAEVESDKAVMELECFQAGVVAQIKHGDESEVHVGEVIALIAAEGAAETGEVTTKTQSPPAKARRAAAGHEEPQEQRKEAGGEPERKKATTKAPPRQALGAARHKEEKAEPARPAVRTPGSAIAPISPYAKKLAAERGIDVTTIAGTGPGGRIVAKDIEALGRTPAPKAPKPRPDEDLPALDVTDDEADVLDMPFRLKTQALRVTHSKHLIPHFYLTRGADVTKLLQRREELKEKFGATVTHLVAYACVRALVDVPDANRSYDRGKIIKWKGVNLGIAVATDKGLTVAVVRNAQDLSFEQLVGRAKELVERARAGRLSADERSHASFTITNLGMFDVEHFEPIINPPSSITLGVASALPATIVRNGQIFIGREMKFSASCDHRIIDGVTGATFLSRLVELLEHPDELLG